MWNLVMSFLKDDAGATAVEWCFIAGGIAVAILAAVNTLGGALYPIYVTADGSPNGP